MRFQRFNPKKYWSGVEQVSIEQSSHKSFKVNSNILSLFIKSNKVNRALGVAARWCMVNWVCGA
jgi:hypothetical protein